MFQNTILTWFMIVIVGYAFNSLLHDYGRLRLKIREDEVLDRDLGADGNQRHLYQIKKVLRYDIFVDGEFFQTTETLEQAKWHGEWEVASRNRYDKAKEQEEADK
jgi:hypothetical protein